MPDNFDNNEYSSGVILHAAAEISVNPNYTTAFLTIKPPENGGLDITYDKVMQALQEKNISSGIMEDAIKQAVDGKKYGENICVARWTAPVDGVDGKITYSFQTESNIAPVEDESGVVDYKNLGLVRNITRGTVIAEITLPTEGTPGKDIMGRVVNQKKGIAAKFTVGAGTSLINDGTTIISTIDGNLRYHNGGFVVEETLVIAGDVGPTTGNIDFIGSVTVRGNVFEGFKVVSKKDIIINGSVSGSEIIADGSVVVKIGSINSTIISKGSVKLGFCESSIVRCEGSVESASFIGGEVFAGGSIIASGKGIMVGGKYTALDNVSASVIGSEKYTKTLVTLGNNAVLSEERDALVKSIAEMEDKMDQLGKILATLSEYSKVAKLSPEHEKIKTNSLRSRLQLQSELKKSKKRIEEIDQALELCQNLSVSCKRSFYPGVTLRINSCVLLVNTENQHCRATVENGDIVFRPL